MPWGEGEGKLSLLAPVPEMTWMSSPVLGGLLLSLALHRGIHFVLLSGIVKLRRKGQEGLYDIVDTFRQVRNGAVFLGIVD